MLLRYDYWKGVRLKNFIDLMTIMLHIKLIPGLVLVALLPSGSLHRTGHLKTASGITNAYAIKVSLATLVIVSQGLSGFVKDTISPSLKQANLRWP
jgi:hypothetical protein